MKGKVFIGWNSSNEIAKLVKENLYEYGYSGIVGGKDGNVVEHGVGATIISQMRSCCSAIMLFSVRNLNEDNAYGCEKPINVLSSNMLFELGYLVGSLKLKRVLIVYIDGAEKYAPSDLFGAWSLTVSSANRSLKEIAEEIVKLFMSEQMDALISNKMRMTIDIAHLRAILEEHSANPVYFNDEIAQLCLMFSQSGYLHNDIKNTVSVLENLRHSGVEDECCLLAISTAIDCVEVCEVIDSDAGDMYLTEKNYAKYEHKFANSINICHKLSTKPEFKTMILMILYDYMTFIDLLYYGHKEKVDLPQEIWEKRVKYGLDAIKYSEEFIKLNPELNRELAYLYEGYTYRNLAMFYKFTGRPDLSFDMFENSCRVRYALLQFFMFNDLNINIQEQISMEYYLSLTDNLDDVDEETKKTRMAEIATYLDEIEVASYNRSYLNRKIKAIYEKHKSA